MSSGAYRRVNGRLLQTFTLPILLGRRTVPTGVALGGKLLGRLVVQRTMRPHRVVLALEPPPFLLGIPLILELLALKELVAEATVERLADSVFPRAARCHLDRLGPLPRQPAGQRLADELAAVVVLDANRRPPRADHSGQHRADVPASHRRSDVQGQALLGVLVHQCQPAQWLARRRAVG